MNDMLPQTQSLRELLTARERELSEREAKLQEELAPIATQLRETRLALAGLDGDWRARRMLSQVPESRISDKLRMILAESGEKGMGAREMNNALMDAGFLGELNISSRLSVMKSRGDVEKIGRNYVMRPELRAVILEGAATP